MQLFINDNDTAVFVGCEGRGVASRSPFDRFGRRAGNVPVFALGMDVWVLPGCCFKVALPLHQNYYATAENRESRLEKQGCSVPPRDSPENASPPV